MEFRFYQWLLACKEARKEKKRTHHAPTNHPTSSPNPALPTSPPNQSNNTNPYLQNLSLAHKQKKTKKSASHPPLFFNPNPLAVLPKANSRLCGSSPLISLSKSFLTSSFTLISSGVGKSWITKSKRHCERSLTNRVFEGGRRGGCWL